jgi:hypothetical protein
MGIAATASREDKTNWLLRPFEWAFTVSWYAACFGIAIYWTGKAHEFHLLEWMVASTVVISGLMIWGIRRMKEAAMSYAAGKL